MDNKMNIYDACMVADYNTSFDYFVDYFDETATVKGVIEYGDYFYVIIEYAPEYGEGAAAYLFVQSNDLHNSQHRAFHVAHLDGHSFELLTIGVLFEKLCAIYFDRFKTSDIHLYTSDGKVNTKHIARSALPSVIRLFFDYINVYDQFND